MKDIIQKLGITLLPDLTGILIRTLKIKIHNLPVGKENSIFIFWHSQMIIGWWLFKDKTFAAIVSTSKDGDILDNLLNKWNYKVVRGSSSRGGKEALQELINSAKNGNSVVLTPDGPRGPANEMKNGAFIISNKCKIPIIPVRIVFHKKKILEKSWDRFEIPMPFSKCDVYFGNKYNYDTFLDDDKLAEFKKNISVEM